jgi:UMF1 family MFS transporter
MSIESPKASPESVAPPSRRALFSWCLFDWANSPFATVVVTFVFAVYFKDAIVGDEIRATALWGYTLSASALAVAILGPILGSAADAGARRKPWLFVCSAVTVVACAGLWFATPDAGSIWLVLILVGIANLGFELGMVFYNAMLAGLAGDGRIGRLSGWAWGLGYVGGLACLIVALFGFIQVETPPFGLDPDTAEPVRAIALLVAAWFVVFGWPLFAFTPDLVGSRRSIADSLRIGLATLARTLRSIREYRMIARFLIGRMLYIDGLNTLFAFGGLYAAGTFDMELTEVLYFAVALNVAAGIGAFGFGWVDDWLGSKRTLVISLIALIIVGGAILLIEDKLWFWILGMLIGVFMGPTQAASRSMMARLAPVGMHTEMFGLFAFSGKATAFMGPWLVAYLTTLAGSQRVGMSVVLVFFVVGLAILFTVREPGRD